MFVWWLFYLEGLTFVLTGRNQYNEVIKSIQNVSTINHRVPLYILITVLHIFKVPLSVALCILWIVMFSLSFGMFSFSKFGFSVSGTVHKAPMVTRTVVNLYPLCNLCSLAIKGIYFISFLW